jgi:hypothetical protein
MDTSRYWVIESRDRKGGVQENYKIFKIEANPADSGMVRQEET